MKRILLLGFVLAICILAMPQGVMADTKDDTAIVNAQLTAVELNFKVTEDINPWVLGRGANDLVTAGLDPIKIEVDSSNYWTVSAEAEASGHKGHLISTGDGAEWLNKALFIQTAESMAALDGAAIPVGSGNPGGYTETAFTRNLHQEVVTTDKALDNYQITLTFTVVEH